MNKEFLQRDNNSEGDLRAENLNKTCSSLQFGVQHIEEKIDQLMQEEIEVSDYLEDVADTYSQISNIGDMTGKINDDFKNFGSYANQINEIIDHSMEVIDHTESNVDELAENIHTTNDQLDNITNVFNRLEADFSNIRNLSNGINSIAMQSKLLAFNASIESERAGSAGMAFAVVAEEMGRLSKSTKDLVEGIDDNLMAMLKSIEDVKKEIINSKSISRASLKKVEDVKQNTSEVEGCTADIKNFSHQIIDGIESTSNRINGAAEGFGAISQVVDSFGEKIDTLNIKMSKKSSIICSVIDFLQQMENMLDEV
ncbi:methyl-accepting chemotaxis protein [Eubacteriaceae bacterium ES3]|nr:methyl-accepting chemotaxis protein [Eubacteriaceae bacterium ES3]